MPWLLKTLLALVAVYGLYTLALILLQGIFIYPFSDRPFRHEAYRLEEVPVPGADPLPLWIADGIPGEPRVVYFMGNVGALDLFLPMLEHHRSRGREVIAMTYRGGGGTPGRPSEARLKADARALMAALPQDPGAGPLVLHGFSLGSGLALHVADHPEVDGVLLTAPYAELCRLMTRAARVPACVLPFVQAWRSTEELAGIEAPVRILHGSEDSLIPPEESLRLTQSMRAAGIDVTHQIVPGGGHNDLMSQPNYLAWIDDFIDKLPR